MKCRNFLCNKHRSFYNNGCLEQPTYSSYCTSRKTYNRIMSGIQTEYQPNLGLIHVEDKLYHERKKYYGRE